jgi:putative endonuclease
MSILSYCVYVLRSELDGNLYIGFTEDLPSRFRAHADGLVQSTRPRRPFILVYCEYHTARSDAMRRERYLKTSAGKKALKLMLRDALGER